MATVRFGGRSYALNSGESVLDGLLRHDVRLNYSCKAGVCGSCMLRAESGIPPARSQSSLKDSWRTRGYFLACACVPEEDIDAVSPGAEFRFEARIGTITPLSGDVVLATLLPESHVEFRAGQYVTVVREDGLARSYSIASLPGGAIELHIRKIPNGQMSGWFHAEARSGSAVGVLGPNGECFYVAGREQQPMILAGTGTGLAPLYGILRDALLQGHSGPIHVFHGALREEGLYLVNDLRDIARRHIQVRYTPAVLRGEPTEGIEVGPLDQVILRTIPDLTGWRGFVCGDPALVQDIKRKLFLNGMASRDIYADAFIAAAR